MAWESPEAEGGRVGSCGVCLLLLGMLGEDLLMEFRTGLTACEPVLQECPYFSPSIRLIGPWATTLYAIYLWDFWFSVLDIHLNTPGLHSEGP